MNIWINRDEKPPGSNKGETNKHDERNDSNGPCPWGEFEEMHSHA